MMKCRININIATTQIATNLFLLLMLFLPIITLINKLFYGSGAIKDMICVFICFIALFSKSIIIKQSYLYGLLYVGLVTIGVFFINIDMLTAIDLFRYRCEYLITIILLFAVVKFKLLQLDEFVAKVFKVIFLTSLIVAVIGLIEYFNPEKVYLLYGDALTQHLTLNLDGGVSRRLISTMSNPINLGLQMALGAVSILYLLQYSRGNSYLKKSFLYASLLLFLFISFMTYSRTAYVSVFCILASNYLMKFFLVEQDLQKKVVWVLVVFLITILGGVYLSSVPDLYVRISTINFEAFLSNTRFVRATEAFSSTGENILNYVFGNGIGNIIGGSNQYVFELGWASLLFETGIVGVLIFFIYIIRSFYITRCAIKYNKEFYRVCCAFFSFIVGFVAAMLAEDCYAQLPYSIYFWLSVFVIEEYKKYI